MNIEQVRAKYNSIRDRSFDSYIELFLIWSYLQDNTLNIAGLGLFEKFDYDSPNIEKCNSAFQLSSSNDDFNGSPVEHLDIAIDDWYKRNKDIKQYKDYFVANRLISKEDFFDFYGDDPIKRKCEYCGIKEQEIHTLIESGKIQTKRLRTRGRYLEVDRIKPNQGYVKGNIVLCCYWCNNAKTDEFSKTEFEKIGKSIGEVFKERLK